MKRILLAAALLWLAAAPARAADGFIQVPPDSNGKIEDHSALQVGGQSVLRQRMVICDGNNASGCAPVDAGLGLSVSLTNPFLAVNVGNFPSSQNVVCTSGCSGSTGASFAAAFPTTGTAIGMTQGGLLTAFSGTSGNLNVNLAGNSFGTLTVGGSVSVSNFPATQPVSGTVAVSNFPATQPVSGTVAATQSGTWTVQPGNTANTTAWKVDGSAVTQPVSGTVTANQGGAPWSVSGSGTFTTSDNHYPAAGALSDALANPTTTEIGVNNLGWDNTNTVWRRLQVDAGTGTLKVDPGTVAVTGTFFQATQPVSGTVTTSPPSNASSNVAQINGVTPLMGNGVTGTGSPRVTIASDNTAFSVNSAQSGTWTVQPGNTANTTAWKVDGSAVTQPVSGTVTAVQTTGTNLHIVCDSGCSSSTAPADESAFTAGTTPQSPVGGFFQTTPTSNPLTTGQQGAFQVTANRALFVNPRNAAGTEIATASNPLRVDPTGTTTQPVSGTVTANAGTGTFTVSGTVTANAGTNLNTSALALDATAAKLNNAQASTTAGETGPLVQGAVTTAAPTYTTAQTSPLSLTTAGALRTDASATTQPVSGTVAATQSGTWTVQPGNTANTTAWKVDGSAVTQPVSGTVTGNQGTANSAANAWTTKVTDGTNVGAVKAASTAAAATDPSTVTQLSPNQPQLTTPLNVQGGKTNNNAAPGATNFGTLDSLANAAPPTWTEGDQVALSQDLGGNVRVYSHPPTVLGCYQVNTRTPTYAGLAIAAPLFSMRWGDATHIAIVTRVQIFVVTTGTATTVGLTERELVIARSFTASDTGGTAIVLTTNNNKMRTSQGTSLVTNMQVGGPLTAGTRTLDVNAVASVAGWSPLTTVGIVIGSAGAVAGSGFVNLFDATNGQQYPIVLATNEGIIVRIGKDAEPAGATQQTYLNVNWCEASAY